MSDDLYDLANEIRSSRRFCAVLWGFVLAFAIAAMVYEDPMALTLTAICGFVTLLLTLGMGKAAIDERLARPRQYRLVTGAFLALAVFGGVLGMLPDASDDARVLAVYFGIVALYAYRGLVARGPRPALGAVSIAAIASLPFMFLIAVTGGCGRGPAVVPWTQVASRVTLEILMLMVPVLAAVTLIAFSPRHDFVPEARALAKR